jgi:hypothetical protein
VEVSYGITSLPPSEARAAQLEAVWRGHWTIENRKHYVRDVTLGEDRNQMHSGDAPRVLATLRSGLTVAVERLDHYCRCGAGVRCLTATNPHPDWRAPTIDFDVALGLHGQLFLGALPQLRRDRLAYALGSARHA